MRDLTQFLDAELDYHERCAEELRRVRKTWVASGVSSGPGSYGSAVERRPTARSRSSTAASISRTNSHNIYEADEESEAPPVRMPIRSANTRSVLSVQPQNQQVDGPPRSVIGRASTFQGGASLDRERVRSGSISGASTPGSTYAVNQNIPNVGSLRGQLRPVGKIVTNRDRDDVFGDRDDENTSDSGSPDYRSTSPATSVGSLSRSYSNAGSTGNGFRKAPPPPPPSRSKKPPPPVPARREIGY